MEVPNRVSRRRLMLSALASCFVPRGAFAWTQRSGIRVYPEDFYRGGDGSDWLPAMIRAQAAGRVVVLGRDYPSYSISSAIPVLSNKSWLGLSRSVKLVNPKTAPLDPDWAAFELGNIHPYMFNYPTPLTGQLPSYNTNDIHANDLSVQLSTPSNYTEFSVGQFVAVRTQAQYDVRNGNLYPGYAQFTKVANVSTSGLVTLADPILEAITGACISPIGTLLILTQGNRGIL